MNAASSVFRSPSRFAVHTRYVLQDYLLLRAALPVVLIGFAATMVVRSTVKFATPKTWADPRFIAGTHMTYTAMSGVLLYFTVFLAVIAVMTIDRTTGYYRFFFSKPVNVVSYYLHTFCAQGAAMCAILALFALAWGGWMPRESLHRAMLAGAIAFALIGGLGFAFGALTNLDAALTPLAFIFAISTQFTLVGYAGPPKWLVLTARVLPPAADFEKTRALLNSAQAFAGSPLWHVLAYGAGAWLVGLVALRRGRLAR